MEKLVDIKDLFFGTLEKAQEIEKEFKRLGIIEERLTNKLRAEKERIALLEKTMNYASVSYDVKTILEGLCHDAKKQANDIAWMLGLDKLYQIKE